MRLLSRTWRRTLSSRSSTPATGGIQPALLIGDRAIDAQQTFAPAHVHDLGTDWHAWTGGDMVYAVWAVRRDVLASHRDEVGAALAALIRAQRWGTEHSAEVVAAAQAARARPAGFYAAYFATLNFAFDAAARSGLRRYIEELHALGAVSERAPVEPEEFVVHR